ncbi:MAG: hypothetical protein PHC28_14035 [Flavobacterium sp.]|uniref:hypothetical protein n=1 Tax=Flavobacterium sp. TaxID=239 RepID=UPI0026276ABF|nr:hypothetical protein [Flavobacterium sp.]MDD5151572.1 hypothetical protein [Flavobacterium sp.]
MKKIITLLAVVGMFSFQSCTVTDNGPIVDTNTISEVFEVTTSFNSTNNYSKLVTFNPSIYSSDVVLVYRLSGMYQGQDLWKLLPETHYFSDGTLDFGYDFDFTKNDVNIYMVGNDLQSVSTDFRVNQVLRVVIVPASFAASFNTNNYAAVISALNINENQIQKINF